MSNTADPGDDERDDTGGGGAGRAGGAGGAGGASGAGGAGGASGEDAHEQARRENHRRRRHSDGPRDVPSDEKAQTHGEAGQLSAIAESGPAFAAPEPRMRDLSADLMQILPRSSGEMVRCRRIIGDHYRCNWWGSRNGTANDNVGASGVMITRFRVVKSRMLRATVTRDGVAIDADGVQ
jgi:hypothetical protein